VSGPASTLPSSSASNGGGLDRESSTLDNLGTEDRVFPPSAGFAANANLTGEAYERAAADPEAFWGEQAGRLSWFKPFTTVLDWSGAPHARWFPDGELNVAYNCVDRHVEAGFGDTVAIHWEGEPGDSKSITYADLQREVSKTANALISLGLRAGDRVAIYLPMIPEAVYSMLACARLGLAHSVVFAGFRRRLCGRGSGMRRRGW
jgi:acetyl-CoA synthetase